MQLSSRQFEKISQFVCRLTGIHLKPGKEEMVKSRLNRRIAQLGMSGFDEYFKYVQRPGNEAELTSMLDALTTNKTGFFREKAHFEFLCRVVLPSLRDQQRIRIWSAGCSSGEEPVTIAMLLREHFQDCDQRDVRVLATDLSTQVLSRARQGCFPEKRVSALPKALLGRYFSSQDTPEGLSYQARPEVLSLIGFARLNLMSRWPMRGPFQVIFCRNVMIYFDRLTQERLVGRFAQLLAPGGHFFVGHSESLTGRSHPFRFIQPAVYQKPHPQDLK